MVQTERVWCDLERVTALRNNEDKCKRWELGRVDGIAVIRGELAITLGVVAPSLHQGAEQREVERVEARCRQARLTAQLPVDGRTRKVIIAAAPAAGLAWDRVCRPLRVKDRNSFDASVRVGICDRKWISAEPSLLLLMVGGHNVAIGYRLACRLEAVLSCM
eukprot:9997091-Alexandrium_andersonii.AAC.1